MWGKREETWDSERGCSFALFFQEGIPSSFLPSTLGHAPAPLLEPNAQAMAWHGIAQAWFLIGWTDLTDRGGSRHMPAQSNVSHGGMVAAAAVFLPACLKNVAKVWKDRQEEAACVCRKAHTHSMVEGSCLGRCSKRLCGVYTCHGREGKCAGTK